MQSEAPGWAASGLLSGVALVVVPGVGPVLRRRFGCNMDRSSLGGCWRRCSAGGALMGPGTGHFVEARQITKYEETLRAGKYLLIAHGGSHLADRAQKALGDTAAQAVDRHGDRVVDDDRSGHDVMECPPFPANGRADEQRFRIDAIEEPVDVDTFDQAFDIDVVEQDIGVHQFQDRLATAAEMRLRRRRSDHDVEPQRGSLGMSGIRDVDADIAAGHDLLASEVQPGLAKGCGSAPGMFEGAISRVVPRQAFHHLGDHSKDGTSSVERSDVEVDDQQLSVGLRHSGHLVDERESIGCWDLVQHHRGHDEVEVVGRKWQRVAVAVMEIGPVSEPIGRPRQHRSGHVDTRDLAFGFDIGDQSGPGPAADIEDTPAGFGR